MRPGACFPFHLNCVQKPGVVPSSLSKYALSINCIRLRALQVDAPGGGRWDGAGALLEIEHIKPELAKCFSPAGLPKLCAALKAIYFPYVCSAGGPQLPQPAFPPPPADGWAQPEAQGGGGGERPAKRARGGGGGAVAPPPCDAPPLQPHERVRLLVSGDVSRDDRAPPTSLADVADDVVSTLLASAAAATSFEIGLAFRFESRPETELQARFCGMRLDG